MQAISDVFEEYLDQLPEDRKTAMTLLRETILENLPEGFEERIGSKMIHYVVPHSLYPAGYHCDPKEPLPFLSIASQKNFIAMYHMGLYGDTKLLQWFKEEYPRHSKSKLDMGKSCVRFKKPATIPLELIAALVGKINPQQWIELYEVFFKKNR